MSDISRHDKGLLRIFIWATAFSFGILAAIAFSMKDFIGGNATFDFSYKTVLGFIGGTVAGWLFWQFVQRRIREAAKNKQSGST
jgi:hypothetical protein